MSKNLGIDLGTTNSCISYLEGKEPAVIPTPEGSRVIPSMIALTNDNQKIFGNIAKRQLVTNNRNTLWGIKRLIGRKYDSREATLMRQRIGYHINKTDNGDISVSFGGAELSPEELSGMFLKYLADIASDYLGEKIKDTVVTVPAYFNDSQRQATQNAGKIAGLNISRIINEPTAALIAYGSKIKKDGIYAVYDLGGGTFDISIVEVSGEIYKVISTLGDTFLGGQDFDAKVIEWIIDSVEQDIGNSFDLDLNTSQRILQVAEKSKIELSFNQETTISIPYLLRTKTGEHYHFQKKLSRAELESRTEDLINKTVSLIRQSLKEAGLTPDRIEKTILVGGQSRMPLIYRKLNELFNKPPAIDLNPEEVVAQGAAIQSEIIRGKVKDLLLLDVTPLTLGVETKDDSFTKIIEKNSTIPIKKSMTFTTITDNQRTVKIHVIQGERELASENKSLGYFNLIGIPLAPRGIPQIEVTFEIDANGIVKVSAADKQTGLSQSMEIQPSSGLAPEEIDRIVKDAGVHQKHDEEKKHLTKIKASLKEEIESVEFFYNRHTEKLTLKMQSEVRSLVSRTKTALEENENDVLESLLNRATTLRIKINNILLSEFES